MSRRAVQMVVFGFILGAIFANALPYIAERFDFEFLAPDWRWIALCTALLWAPGIGSLWQAPNPQRVSALGLRTLALWALVLAMVQPVRYEREPQDVSVLVLQDRSSSVNAKDADVLDMDPIQKKIGSGRIGYHPFGDPKASDGPQLSGAGSELDRVLELVPTLIRGGMDTRVVLRTDGGNTGGALSPVVGRLNQAGIAVYQERLPSLLDGGDIAVTGIEHPQRVLSGRKITIAARVHRAADVPVECSMKLGKELRTKTPVEGDLVTFANVLVPSSDAMPLVVSCERSDGVQDAVEPNNRYTTLLVPEQPPKVLIVDSQPSRARSLADALGSGFDVTVRGGGGLPTTKTGWAQFDVVLVSDLPRITNYSRNNFSPRQMAMADRYVRDGGALFMIGGPQALGPGGYIGTRLEQKTLPVWLDTPRTEQQPKLALVLVLDRSGSMTGLKLNLAKKAAAATAESLGRNDRIGVVVFDAKADVVVNLQRAANRFRILSDVARIKAGGGTKIQPALAEAFRMLKRAPARFRHVILLTDGQSPRGGVLDTVQSMTDRGITVSTIAVGQSADRTMLREIADLGAGRYHYTNSPERIPRIFLRETRELRRDTAATGNFRPRLTKKGRRLPYLRKLERLVPSLGGLVLVRAKPGSDVLMKDSSGNPLLVTRRHGRGTVAVFASDAKGIWSSRWIQSTVFPRFWRSMIRSALSDKNEDLPTVELIDRRDRLVAQVRYPMSHKGAMEPTIRVRTMRDSDEDWQVLTAAVRAPGVLEAELVTSEPQTALFEVTVRPDDPRSPVLRNSITRPYEAELNPELLEVGRKELVSLSEEGLLPPATMAALTRPGRVGSKKRTEYWQMAIVGFLASWILGLILRRIPIGRTAPEGWL
ncbi:MAG: hypothetical protein CMH54_07910 [Myxococcales bacterium]|nr:hypothetical protein [Myxococcales bacterium]